MKMKKTKWIIGETHDNLKLECNFDDEGNAEFVFNGAWTLPKMKINKEELTSLFFELAQSLPEIPDEGTEDPNGWDGSLDWDAWNERRK